MNHFVLFGGDGEVIFLLICVPNTYIHTYTHIHTHIYKYTKGTRLIIEHSVACGFVQSHWLRSRAILDRGERTGLLDSIAMA